MKGASALFFVVMLMLETPDAFDDWPPKLFIRFNENARDCPETTADFFELPDGPPASTLLPDPGLFY